MQPESFRCVRSCASCLVDREQLLDGLQLDEDDCRAVLYDEIDAVRIVDRKALVPETLKRLALDAQSSLEALVRQAGLID